MKKKIALLSAMALISLTSCSGSSATAPDAEPSADSSQSESEDSTDESSENEDTTDDENTADNEDTTDTDKDPDKYNTYPMDELFSEGSPLIGYWHTDNKDMYIEYNEFGDEGFTVMVLGKDMQIFSSQIGTFSGTPQNTEYILASSPEDEDVRNLYNKDTKLSMAINDNNSISVFLDYGYGNTSTYTFEKGHPPYEAMTTFIGDWGNDSGVDVSFTYEEGKDTVQLQTVFGFSSDIYPIAIPSVNDNNECWLCCPYKGHMLTTYSDQGVFYDVINVHMELNSDGTLNANRDYTNPTLGNNNFLRSGSVLRKFA